MSTIKHASTLDVNLIGGTQMSTIKHASTLDVNGAAASKICAIAKALWMPWHPPPTHPPTLGVPWE